MKKKLVMPICSLILFFSFLSSSGQENTEDISHQKTKTYKYLALGDSYTIGESVCNSCNFPQQLTDSLNQSLEKGISVKIIAETGWTTSDLISAINHENPKSDYDLVTLLIGVNNQYQGQNFSRYKEEFPQLLNKAIHFAKGNPKNVIVVSIPDYAFTPFGQSKSNTQKISEEIVQYNSYAQQIATQKGVIFQNITDITRFGLEQPELIASDGLHPSKISYKKFVDRLIEKALSIIN